MSNRAGATNSLEFAHDAQLMPQFVEQVPQTVEGWLLARTSRAG